MCAPEAYYTFLQLDQKKIKLLLPFLCLIVLNSCDSLTAPRIVLDIDNPTEEPLTLSINGTVLQIQPLRTQPYPCQGLEHQIQFGEIDTTLKFQKRGRYLLNPSLTTYVKEELTYQRPGGSTLGSNPTPPKIPIHKLVLHDSLTIVGRYKAYHKTLLIGDYHWNPADPHLPTISSESSVPQQRIRLHRIQDFMKQAARQFGEVAQHVELEALDLLYPIKPFHEEAYQEDREKLLQRQQEQMAIIEFRIKGRSSFLYKDSGDSLIYADNRGLRSTYSLLSKQNLSTEQQSLWKKARSFNWDPRRSTIASQRVETFPPIGENEVCHHYYIEGQRYSACMPFLELARQMWAPIGNQSWRMKYGQAKAAIALTNPTAFR